MLCLRRLLVAMTLVVVDAAVATPPRSALREHIGQANKLGLGLASLGRPGYINLGHDDDLPAKTVDVMRERAYEVLDAAAALGITYFDCARSYGEAEEFAASWVASRPEAAAKVTVGSKWGYAYTAGWRTQVSEGEAHELKELSLAQLNRQLSESLALLPGLRLYQIHSATMASGVLSDGEVLGALARLRDGTLRPGVSPIVPGLSVSHPQVGAIEAAAALCHGGKPLFGQVQATFNLLDQSAAAALAAAHDAGMVVVVKEALANGRLTCRAPPTPGLAVLRREAEALGVPEDALALAWVMSHPFVDVCLSGATTVAQLSNNAEALKLLPLAPHLMHTLAEALRQGSDEYWADRRALAWN